MQEFDYQSLYDTAYEKFTPEWTSQATKVDAFLVQNRSSLVSFFETYLEQNNLAISELQGLKVLDLGTGLGSLAHYFSHKGAKTTGLDVSGLALTLARKIAIDKNLSIDFLHRDITLNSSKIAEFDYIIDSHLFHCLISAKDRALYFEFIENNLGDGAVLLLESMVFQKNIQIPIGYYLDENSLLWKERAGPDIPYRTLLTGHELEQSVLSSGLSIDYLYFHPELAMNPFSEFPEHPHEHLPHLARIAVKRKKAK